MQWKNGVIGGAGMALIGGVIDGPQYAVVMGVAGFIAALFWFRPVQRPNTAAAVEPPREADK
jgi:hypothetical protein